jgi:hypothetical protein
MSSAIKCVMLGVAVLLVAVFVLLSFMAGGPKDVYYLVRYAFPHMRFGDLRVGKQAPDVRLVALDGTTRFHLREKTSGRPLVVVFGSFT